MFCQKCGKEQLETVKFCTDCGSNITEIPAVAQSLYAPTQENSKKKSFWGKYFSWQGRISRKRFWITSMYLIGLFIMLLIVLYAIGNEEIETGLISGLCIIAGFLAIVMAGLSTSVRAAHNYDKSAVWALLPPLSMYIFFLLVFKSGMTTPNKYGAPPIN